MGVYGDRVCDKIVVKAFSTFVAQYLVSIWFSLTLSECISTNAFKKLSEYFNAKYDILYFLRKSRFKTMLIFAWHIYRAHSSRHSM